jgi:hypothetical protein
LEPAQMFTDRWTKCVCVCVCVCNVCTSGHGGNRVLCNRKKELNSDTCYNNEWTLKLLY